ncbi:MAG TPA: rRNA maturation RNase YbeY [Candidatus Dojkabacteria bacterium]|nr:rRNA maturation RNase YbeY [Candidatus Dojkabacteria bacterium]
MILEISNWDTLKKVFSKAPFSKEEFERVLEKHFFEYNFYSLGIIFVSARYIQALNRQYRGVDSVTDVLSFNIEHEPLVGEVYICPEYIKKNTHTDFLKEEVIRDIIHGILHIVGYDHKGEFSERNIQEEMFVKQEDILHNILDEINNRSGESRGKIPKE